MDDQNRVITTEREIISTGEWVLYLFLFAIPLVNIIILCIWAFGDQPNPTKTNYGRAMLIWIAIGIVLYAIFFFFIVSFFAASIPTGNVSV